ncbi:F-box protein PP2-B15-like [Quercus lobata]|uniref:F-box domain-containing protein n=1 Tax=Quercus lobata TaxID=97700 RepID=A0A7N2L5Q2_QUELO|nr:F-box protein PP2-B15-like [Quercus lobata]
MGGLIDMLPGDCVSKILSFTSPTDAYRSSMVSSMFHSAAESDVVWEMFYYKDVVSRLIAPLTFTTKKELFVCLCNLALIDGGRKSFKLEKLSGKISYMLSARELSITWGNDPMQWSWKSIPQSRFSEVAKLRTTSWLEIRGKINTQILSSNTRYGAYLIMKISNRAYGLDSIPSEVSIEVGNKVCNGMAYLRHEDGMQQQMEYMFYRNRIEVLRKRVIEGTQRTLNEREDGWLEIELGEFFSGEANEEVKMSLMEVKGYQLKGGLVIEGIEVRPRH